MSRCRARDEKELITCRYCGQHAPCQCGSLLHTQSTYEIPAEDLEEMLRRHVLNMTLFGD